MLKNHIILFIEKENAECYISIISIFISISFQRWLSLNQNSRRTRSVRNYPAHTFQETLDVASYIQKYGTEGVLLRISLADHLNMSPKSSNFTTLLSAGEQYKITSGRYNDEFISLTDIALSILSPRSQEEKNKALIEAIYAPKKFGEFNSLENEHGRIDEQFLNSIVTRDISIHPDMANEYINIYKANRTYYDSTAMLDIGTKASTNYIEAKPSFNEANVSNEKPTTEITHKEMVLGQILIITLGQKTNPENRIAEFLTGLNLKVKKLTDSELKETVFTKDEKESIKRVIIEISKGVLNLDLMSIGFIAGLSFGLSGQPAIITGPETVQESEIELLKERAKFISYERFNDLAVQLILELQSSGNLNISLS